MTITQKNHSHFNEITLVSAQSPRYYPHVHRHLKSLNKRFSKVRLLYWEKDSLEPVYQFPGVEVERFVLSFRNGGMWFFFKLMAGLYFRLIRMQPASIEAIDPYALVPARLYSLLGAKAGNKPRIAYFSMEYFAELPSLRNKPFKRWIWKGLEKWGVAGVASVATVCDSIARHLHEDFGIPIVTVRNVPERSVFIASGTQSNSALHQACGLNPMVDILIYQGMLQEGRGLEAAVKAMQSAPNFHFAIIGGGPLMEPLQKLAIEHACEQRVHFLGEVDFQKLTELTRNAYAGLAPFQDLSTSYRFSLPGKLFEYIQAGIPVITTDLPEIKKIVTEYDIGICLSTLSPEALSTTLLRMEKDPTMNQAFRRNMPRAQAELCWDVEEAKYLLLYS